MKYMRGSYDNAFVYKLYTDIDKYYYIGSTSGCLEQRRRGHIRKSNLKVNKWVSEVGSENIRIKVISYHYNIGRTELRKIEDKKIKDSLDDIYCLNIKRECPSPKVKFCQKKKNLGSLNKKRRIEVIQGTKNHFTIHLVFKYRNQMPCIEEEWIVRVERIFNHERFEEAYDLILSRYDFTYSDFSLINEAESLLGM